LQLPDHVSPLSASFLGIWPLGILPTPPTAWLLSRSLVQPNPLVARHASSPPEIKERYTLVISLSSLGKIEANSRDAARHLARTNRFAQAQSATIAPASSTSLCDCSGTSHRAPDIAGGGFAPYGMSGGASISPTTRPPPQGALIYYLSMADMSRVVRTENRLTPRPLRPPLCRLCRLCRLQPASPTPWRSSHT
jgi:hypothetical protein